MSPLPCRRHLPIGSMRRRLMVWRVLRQHSTGGKQVLGRLSKMGQHDIRPASHYGCHDRHPMASRGKASPGSWLTGMLTRKPPPVIAMDLGNKMARAVWAMLTRSETFRNSDTAPNVPVTSLCAIRRQPIPAYARNLSRHSSKGAASCRRGCKLATHRYNSAPHQKGSAETWTLPETGEFRADMIH